MDRFDSELTLTSTEAARLLEVHPSTVKRWCNEGELPSGTTEGGHRRIELGAAVDFARARGIPTVLTPFEPYEAHVWEALRAVADDGSLDRALSLAMGWVVRGRYRRLGDLFRVLAGSLPLTRFCDDAVRGLMVEVGRAWQEGRLRVGEEHLVSQVMLEVLLGLRGDGKGGSGRVAVVGTLSGNHHHLGALCVRLTLEHAGWTVYYLGADVPTEDFAQLQKGREAELVCISLAPSGLLGDAVRTVGVLRELYDPSRPYALALGGLRVEDDLGAMLGGPFVGMEILDSCEGLIETLADRPAEVA